MLPGVTNLDLSSVLEEKKNLSLDILHTNHVESFDGRLAARSHLYNQGNLLISMRNINTVAILDGAAQEILWIWGPTYLTFQHHPTLLDTGNVLVFNNGTETSQVLEVDPLLNKVVWLYEEPGEFFSLSRGSNQRLANGNTLITESNTGYVLEVTPDKEIVWKFANPDVDPRTRRRATIWRMTRFQPSELSFLGGND